MLTARRLAPALIAALLLVVAACGEDLPTSALLRRESPTDIADTPTSTVSVPCTGQAGSVGGRC